MHLTKDSGEEVSYPPQHVRPESVLPSCGMTRMHHWQVVNCGFIVVPPEVSVSDSCASALVLISH